MKLVVEEVQHLLRQVHDPEIPVISIADLGVLREVKIVEDQLEIVITPTYSGCPAMLEIEKNIHNTLRSAGYEDFKITTVLTPAWTTDWMTHEGRKKLQVYGIAPPKTNKASDIQCPRCQSPKTKLLSEFGSTACKSLYQCEACLEPFDYFKCH